MKNMLYYGDNLPVLREHVKDETIDLIYLDPPFKSNQDYNMIFEEQNGTRSKAQVMAFEDTWRWDQESVESYQILVESGGRISETMQALRRIVGESDTLAYLSMMAPRLIELRRTLKLTGSIYLHCDPTASHYLKMLMDAVFGPENFLNEIIWHYRKWAGGKYTFQRNHDVILFYARSGSRERIFNQLYMPRAVSTLKRFGTAKIISGYDEEGRRIPSRTEENESQGVRQDDVWDIPRVAPIKQLFPTQKPEALLERIILAGSLEGQLVLDPFCGCGTSVVVANRLKRCWIGIDITHLAITLIKHRLKDAFGSKAEKEFMVIGEPVDLSGARALAKQDSYQFQYWALGLLNARPAEKKKGADKGIDGRAYFHDEKNEKTKSIVIQVKSGHIAPSQIRDLRGVMERENAQIGVFLSLENPTKQMRAEAASAGFYESPHIKKKYPRLQILTVEEILQGKQVDFPQTWGKSPFKKGSGSNSLPVSLF